jgi:PTS system mannose-specific IID component
MTGIAKNEIGNLTLLRVFLRSLFIQSCWNFEKMQNIGFAFSMMPALRKIYAGKKDELKEAVKRHLTFFNTHPYFSAPIIGASIKLEEEYSKKKINAEEIEKFKNSLMGICGGVGDSYFWGILRPFSVLIGVIVAITTSNYFAVMICLIVYNINHLSFRVSSLYSGYVNGVSVTQILMKHDFRNRTVRLKIIQAILLGLLLAVIKNNFMIYNFNTMFYNGITYLIFIFVIFLLYFLIKKNFSPILIIYVITTVVILLSYFTEGALWS